jgi:hypothetical protein
MDRQPVLVAGGGIGGLCRTGHVALLGDAAHVMYPTGSHGASQAVIDAASVDFGRLRR